MLASVHSCALVGLDGKLQGLPEVDVHSARPPL